MGADLTIVKRDPVKVELAEHWWQLRTAISKLKNSWDGDLETQGDQFLAIANAEKFANDQYGWDSLLVGRGGSHARYRI